MSVTTNVPSQKAEFRGKTMQHHKKKLRSRAWFDNADNPGMTALYLERCMNYGLTLEELRDHWTYGNRELINRYLGESPLRLVTEPPSAMLATRGVGAAGGTISIVPLVLPSRRIALPFPKIWA